MCCLKYEQDAYEYLNSKMPGVGDEVRTFDGTVGQVASVNVMRQTVRVIVTDDDGNKDVTEYKVDELKFRPRKKKKQDKKVEDKELQKLEALEKEESGSKID